MLFSCQKRSGQAMSPHGQDEERSPMLAAVRMIDELLFSLGLGTYQGATAYQGLRRSQYQDAGTPGRSSDSTARSSVKAGSNRA